MFRASEIFGRKPAAQKRKPELPPAFDGPRARAWDPATGKFVEEELPADLQALLGQPSPAKKAKVEVKEERRPKELLLPPPSRQVAERVLGPSNEPSTVKSEARPPAPSPVGQISTNAPSVEYFGFSKAELNDQYFEKSNVKVHGRPTYWNREGSYFLYWQGAVSRWAFCDGTSYTNVVGGHYPGWAYKSDDHHFSEATGWMEVWDNNWRQAELEVWFRHATNHTIQFETLPMQRLCTSVQFSGFTMQELNTTFHIRPEVTAQGKTTFWDTALEYFLYWQQDNRRWAICDNSCMDDVQKGLAPGWAYRKDSSHFASASGWIELRDNRWKDAIVEIGVCVRPQSMELVLQAEQEVARALAQGVGGAGGLDDDGNAPADVPELRARDYALLIQALYEEVNPKKLQDIARLLQKYRSRERELFHEVCQKYDLKPNVFYHKHARRLSLKPVEPEAQ